MLTMFGDSIARDNLPTIVARPEKAGSRWQGIPHKHLADAFVHSAETRGLGITSEKWSLDKEGARLVGGMTLNMPSEFPQIAGQEYSIAVMANNDMSRALIAATGTTVIVCHNGMLTGELIISRKHTTGLDIYAEINRALDSALGQFRTTACTVENLQEAKLTNRAVDSAFMEMGRRNILPWSAVGKAWKEYEDPTHECFRPYRNRAWGVYNAANEVIKQRNPSDQLDGLDRLTRLLLPAPATA